MVGEIAGPAAQAQLQALQPTQAQNANNQARQAQIDQQIQDNQVQTANSDIGQGLESSGNFNADNGGFAAAESAIPESVQFDSSLERGSLVDEVV